MKFFGTISISLELLELFYALITCIIDFDWNLVWWGRFLKLDYIWGLFNENMYLFLFIIILNLECFLLMKIFYY